MAKNPQPPAPPAPDDTTPPPGQPPVTDETTPPDPPPAVPSRKVLLLVDCQAGKCAEVVEVSEGEAAALVAAGVADDNEAAIAAHEG